MSGHLLSIAAALLLGGAVSCGWTSGDYIEAVWSDDDALFALAVLQYEHPDTNTGEKYTRNERSQMFVVDSELNDAATPVGGEKLGAFVEDTYLMSQAGYLLVTWKTALGIESVRHGLGGGDEIVLPVDDPRLDCDDAAVVRVIPSPPGDLIALDIRCTNDEQGTLEIIDGSTLENLWGPREVPRSDGSWTPDGDYVKFPPDSSPGVRWSPGEPDLVEPILARCDGPPTTSSSISESGQSVRGGSSLEDPVEFPDSDDWVEYREPFGCPP